MTIKLLLWEVSIQRQCHQKHSIGNAPTANQSILSGTEPVANAVPAMNLPDLVWEEQFYRRWLIIGKAHHQKLLTELAMRQMSATQPPNNQAYAEHQGN